MAAGAKKEKAVVATQQSTRDPAEAAVKQIDTEKVKLRDMSYSVGVIREAVMKNAQELHIDQWTDEQFEAARKAVQAIIGSEVPKNMPKQVLQQIHNDMKKMHGGDAVDRQLEAAGFPQEKKSILKKDNIKNTTTTEPKEEKSRLNAPAESVQKTTS